MKRNIVLFTAVLLSLCCLVACTKDDVNLNNGAPVFTLKSLFQGLKTQPQVFTIAAGQHRVIYGESGTKIVIHPGSFSTIDGEPVTSGEIKIELLETLSLGQMIANRVFTTTDQDTWLKSGGAVRIRATQNGSELVATGTYGLNFRVDFSMDSMALFKGYTVADDLGEAVFWNAVDTSNTIIGTTKEPGMGNVYYFAFDSVTALNWINCDYYYNYPGPKTDIELLMPDTAFNATNTQVFVLFRDIRSVAGVWDFDQQRHSFRLGAANSYLPIGATVDVVMVGVKNNVYYVDVKNNVTISNNFSDTMRPVSKTEAQARSILANL